MCTATWTLDDHGRRHVFFSRDERRDRSTGRAPERLDLCGTRVLAPLDPDGGGTWIFGNEFGLGACLLNDWQENGGSGTGRRSRGRLLLDLAGARDLQEARTRLVRSVETARHAPFHLLVFGVDGAVSRHQWNGTALRDHPAPDPPILISSSVSPDQVRSYRTRRLRELCGACGRSSVEDLRDFHLDRCGPASRRSVRMSRPDARTVSLVWMTLAAAPPGGQGVGMGRGPRMTHWHRRSDGAFHDPQEATLFGEEALSGKGTMRPR
ncbi:MAG: hypothetical protein EA352_02390 [Gemmatimonadales bacterium]|nr:MAG: hypothetical protein EA352_02390 [Gemmatimonadales bacterium]